MSSKMRVIVLKMMLVGDIKRHVNLNGWKTYDKVRNEVMKIALDSRAEKNRKKFGHAMDVSEAAKQPVITCSHSH